MKIKLICLFVCFSLVLIFVGCAQPKDNDTNGTTTDSTTTVAPENTTVKDYADDESELPDSIDLDYGNVTMLLRSDRAGAIEEFVIDDYSSSSTSLESAVFSRQAYIEENLNVTVSYVLTPESDLISRVRATISNNLDDFDIVCAGAAQSPTLATEGLLYNWYDVPYVNLDKVWWGARSNMAENLTINDTLYMISGDASQLSLGKALGVYFNKDILAANNMQPDEIYKEVTDYNWTIERLINLASSITNDKDGNQELDENDVWGSNFYLATICDGYFAAFNIPIVTIGDNNEYTIALDNERMANAIDMLHKMCYSSNSTYITSNKSSSEKFFANGHTLFTHGGLEWATDFVGMMESDYGVIPYPMLNKAQGKYYSALSDVYTMFLVPANNDNINAVGAVMELTASRAYVTTTIQYYEIILKGRAMSDPTACEMLDLIHDGLCYDFGFTYSGALGKPATIFRQMLSSSSANDWASFWATNGEVYNNKLQEMLASYE